MTEPLSPSQEAEIHEAYEVIKRTACRCSKCTKPILRDLARRLLEPASPQEKSE